MRVKSYRVNVGLLGRTTAILLVLGLCTHLVHGWQMRRHAGEQVARADASEREGDSNELGASLGRAFAFNPTDQAVRLRNGLHLASAATTPRTRWRALQVLAGVLAREPGQPDVAMKAAELALALGEPGEACKYLTPALAQLPDRDDLNDLYGRAQVANGDAQGAAHSLRRSLELAPSRVTSATLLAELLRGPLGVPKQADAVMERLVKANPDSAPALLARARYLIATARLEPARSDLALARKLDPRDETLWTASAELESLRGDFAAAAGHWQTVLTRKPEQVDAYLQLVRAQRERGRAEEAIEPLRRGLKQMPDQPDLLFALADLLIERGDKSEAESLRARLPSIGAAGRSQYLAGRLEEEQKHWQKAAEQFTKAAAAGDLQPHERARLFLALARCQGKMDVRAERLAAVQHAFQLDPAPSVSLEWARMLLSRHAGGPQASAAAVPLLRSLAQMPVPPERVWALLAQALIENNRLRSPSQRDWSEAETALDRASATKADAITAAQLRVRMHLVRGDADQARKSISEALQRHPDEPLLWQVRVELALLDKAMKSIRPLLDEADRRLAGRVEWRILRADLLARYPDNPALGDLQTLEQSAQRLSGDERDRLQRHLAEIACRMGNYPVLDRLCRSLLDGHPRDLRARVLLLQVKLATDDDRGAEALVAELRRLEGDEGTTWRSAALSWLLSKAERGDRSGLAEARKHAQELRQRRPNGSDVNFLAGRLADLEGKPAEALESYRRVIQQGDFPPLAVRRIVQLLAADGRYVDANDVLEVVDWYGELERGLIRPAAEIALRAGRQDRASALAQAVVPPGSKSARDLVWLGRILQAAGRHTEAQNAFTEAVRLYPGAPDSWLPLLAHLVRQGETQQAEAALARMQREVSSDLLPLATAQALEAMGRPDRAKRAYRLVLKSAPRDGQALMGLLRLYMRDNRNAHAERVLHLLFDPSVLVPEENLPELRRQMALAITSPDRKTLQVERALALLALNRARDPNDPADRRVEALVRGANPEERLSSVRTLEQLSADTPTDAERLRLAQLYDMANTWPQARTQLLSLLEADGRNPGSMAVLIDGLLRHGKKAEAAEWLERLAKIEPETARTQKLRERMVRAVRHQGER